MVDRVERRLFPNVREPVTSVVDLSRLLDLAEPLRTVFFVKNSSLFVGRLVQTTEELVADDGSPSQS